MKTSINKNKNRSNKLGQNDNNHVLFGLGLKEALIAFCLVVVTYGIFSSAFENSFVNWDDQVYVEEQSLVLDKEYGKLFRTPISLNYHPLTMVSLATQVPKNKKDLSANPFIVLNVWIHIFNTLLVFIFIWLLSAKRWWPALMTATVFALHPTHVESVVWVSERKDVLHTFFMLLACITYWKYLGERSFKWLGLVFVLFILSILSKATAVVLPLILLLLDYWKGRDLLNKTTIIEKIPFFALSLFFGLMAVSVQGGGDFGGLLTLFGEKSNALGDFNVFTLTQRFQFACYGFINYMFKFFNPSEICAFYPYPKSNNLSLSQGILYPLATLGTIGLALWSFKRNKAITFGIGFYFISIALVLQFLSVGVALMADRYTYVPYIGLAFALFYSLDSWMKDKNQSIKYVVYGLTSIFIVFLGIKTKAQIGVWKDSDSLWTQVLEYYPTEDLALANRGNFRGKQGDIEAAIKDFEKATSDGCTRADVYEGLGNSYGVLSERNPENAAELVGKAIKMYEQALNLEPGKGNIHFNLGVAQMQTNPTASVKAFNKALELMPYKASEILPPLGLSLLNSGQYGEAVSLLTDAFSKGIQTEAMFYHRGLANLGIGKNDDAIADFKQALVLNPNYKEAKDRLAMMGL